METISVFFFFVMGIPSSVMLRLKLIGPQSELSFFFFFNVQCFCGMYHNMIARGDSLTLVVMTSVCSVSYPSLIPSQIKP